MASPKTERSVTLRRETWVVASRGQVSTELDDGVTILGLHDGVYYGLDGVGARIWQLIQAETTVDEVLGRLLSEYDVDPARCEQDLFSLIRDLLERGLVEVRNAGDS
jgi:hypothetical protein